jgi:hypothetical protein
LPALQDNQLSKLAKLYLEMDTLTEEAIRFLGKLPYNYAFYGFVLIARIIFMSFTNGPEEPSYPKVKVQLTCDFWIRNNENLDVLKVCCCSGSSYQLSDLDRLSELKEVWASGSRVPTS